MRCLCLLLLLLLFAPVHADEVFVRNRPFPGTVVGSGEELYVEASSLAKLLNGDLVEVDGGHLLSLSGESPGKELCGPEKVVVEGELVPSKSGPDGEVLVHLSKAALALGARLVTNEKLGTVDLYLGPERPPGPWVPGSDDWNVGWRKDVTGSLIPDGNLRGRIGGHRFELVQAKSWGGTITFSGGARQQSLKLIMLGRKLGGQEQDVRIKPTDSMTGIHIRTGWVDDEGKDRDGSWMGGYSMRLIVEPRVGDVARGRIYITLPDEEKSFLKGTFNVKFDD